MKSKKVLTGVILLLVLIEIVFSGYLIYKDMQKSDSCVLGSSCSSVESSSYSEIFGIKLFYIALVGFILLLISHFYSDKLFILGSAIGSLFSLYLVYVQLFILKTICFNCMTVHTIMILILIFSLVNFFKK